MAGNLIDRGNYQRQLSYSAVRHSHLQNAAHAARWHCRIGKIRLWTDDERKLRLAARGLGENRRISGR